jgi:hypothetical protein
MVRPQGPADLANGAGRRRTAPRSAGQRPERTGHDLGRTAEPHPERCLGLVVVGAVHYRNSHDFDERATENRGFIRADRDLKPADPGPAWTTFGRDPLPYESSRIAWFAVGDVGSPIHRPRRVRRQQEGAAAVRSVHAQTTRPNQ